MLGGPFVEIVFKPSGNSVLVISSFSIALYDSAFVIFFPPALLSSAIYLPLQLIHLLFFKQSFKCSFPALSLVPSIGKLSSFFAWAMYSYCV